MVGKQAIDISPDYQRRERWDVDKQSALIESFLLNIPVPPVYLSEDEFGSYSVVDGKQRITAISMYLADKFALSNLEGFREIEGLFYSELPKNLRNALEVRPYLRVITLLRQSDPLLKFEVFIRLNRGGESMNAQELRNVAYRGVLNDLIFRLSDNGFLRQQLKIKDNKSSAFQTMQDAEMVLRFFTLRERWRSFSGDYRREMDDFMQRNFSNSDEEIYNLGERFNRAIDAAERIFGDLAFKRPEGGVWRDQFLNGLYDAEMVAIDHLSDESIEKCTNNPIGVLDRLAELFNDKDFDASVRQGTNNPRKVQFRINKMIEQMR